MSALPKAVQDQINKANKLAAEVYSQEDKKDEPTPSDPPSDPPETPAEKPDTEPLPAAAEATPKEEGFDHKYKVLQGKYNAEVPRLQAQLKQSQSAEQELRQRLLNIEGVMAAMQTRDKQEEKSESAVSSLPEITDDEREQFGDDLIDLIARVARRETVPEIESRFRTVDSSLKQVDQRASQVQTTVAQSQRERTLAALAQAVPDWETQNEDPAFLNWLNQVDPFAGQPRGALLTEAFRTNDAQRVITFFTSFRNENAADTSDPAPTPKPAAQESQASLDKFVAPGTPKTGTASAPEESGKRVWTRTDIAAFYAKRNEFINKGKPVPEELQKVERELFKAQAEGRIR